MGRQTDANESAFRFILNHSKAIVSNTYLGPYPRKRLADEPKPAPKTPIRESLNGMAPDDTQNEGRVHGGGLKKPEPREPTNVRVPFPKDHFPETACSGRLP
jgi:hypothetical protein